MRTRELLTWKFAFYRGFLPALRRLGPERADAILAALGRASMLDPRRRGRLVAALDRAHEALGADWTDARVLAPDLAVGALRFLARDYLLETDDDAAALARFEVSGADAFQDALAAGRGVVLVGGHFGGHVAAFHWLYRSGVPLRLMVQRPHHVSAALEHYFDRAGADPQSGFFLRRALRPGECVARVLRARAALKSGKVVYLPGDVPWSGSNTRAGRLLGQSHPLLSVWADLAALTKAPVFTVFCTHRPGGRFALSLELLGPISPGEEPAAVARYLARLERAIAADPADAVAHLLWPCYGPPPSSHSTATPRPSRRAAVGAQVY